MSRIQNKKRACIVAASAILLCLVSLTGATLALFTNNPDDSTIGIIATAGDIEVDIVDLDGNSLVNEALQFQTSSGNRDFLMEPGATFCTQGFKVANKGSIPIQFRLSVSKEIIETTDNKEIVVDMERFLESFDVWITQDPDNAIAAQKLQEFTGELKKDAVTDRPYYLLIRMKDTVGNDFQGRSYSGIGVTVYAVQGDGELPTEAPAETAEPQTTAETEATAETTIGE